MECKMTDIEQDLIGNHLLVAQESFEFQNPFFLPFFDEQNQVDGTQIIFGKDPDFQKVIRIEGPKDANDENKFE